MRLPGRCSNCGQHRQVTVSGSALVDAAARGRPGIPEGLCAGCEPAPYDNRRAQTCKHCGKRISGTRGGYWGAVGPDAAPWYCATDPNPEKRHTP